MTRIVGFFRFGLMMAVVAGALSCNRPVVGPFNEPPADGPEFHVHATVDGQPLNIRAGQDGYILKTRAFPDSITPFAKRSISELVKWGAEASNPGLQLTFLYAPLNPVQSFIDSALSPGLVPLQSVASVGLARWVRLTAEYDQHPLSDPVQSITWHFADGSTELGQTVMKAFPLFPPAQIVQYTIKHQSGCERSIANLLRLGISDEFQLKLDRNPGDNIEVEIEVPGSTSDWEVEVDMGDGSPLRDDFDFHHHYNQSGIFTVIARVYTPSGVLVWQYQKEVATEPQDCYASFEYELMGASNFPFYGRTAEMTYADGQGNTYSTLARGNHQLELIYHEPFKPNQHGQQVHWADLRVDCWMYNDQNPADSLFFSADSLRFGFAF